MNSKSLAIIALVCLSFCACTTFSYNATLSQTLNSYSFLSYCTTANVQTWTCGTPCSSVETLTDRTSIVSGSENMVLVGYKPSDNAIVIAIRGTNNWSNIVQDMTFVRLPYAFTACTNCWVHAGFQNALTSVQPQIQTAFAALRIKYPAAKVWLTGHSLGGAMATLLVPYLKVWNNNQNVDAFFTQGCPRVGDATFSDYFVTNNNFAVASARVTLNQDPVSANPPTAWPISFRHIGYEAFYSLYSDTSAYTLFKEPESAAGQNSVLFPVNLQDHLRYFNYVSVTC